jgi:hypothetical protein
MERLPEFAPGNGIFWLAAVDFELSEKDQPVGARLLSDSPDAFVCPACETGAVRGSWE